MEIRNVGLSISPQFIRSLIQNRSYRNPILNITCYVYCFYPKILADIDVDLISSEKAPEKQCSEGSPEKKHSENGSGNTVHGLETLSEDLGNLRISEDPSLRKVNRLISDHP